MPCLIPGTRLHLLSLKRKYLLTKLKQISSNDLLALAGYAFEFAPLNITLLMSALGLLIFHQDLNASKLVEKLLNAPSTSYVQLVIHVQNNEQMVTQRFIDQISTVKPNDLNEELMIRILPFIHHGSLQTGVFDDPLLSLLHQYLMVITELVELENK
ncbi:hypothetical protein P9112_007375 [Eukaryota sp. TZLM1-RC]